MVVKLLKYGSVVLSYWISSGLIPYLSRGLLPPVSSPSFSPGKLTFGVVVRPSRPPVGTGTCTSHADTCCDLGDVKIVVVWSDKL